MAVSETLLKRLPFLERRLLEEIDKSCTRKSMEAGELFIDEGNYIKWVPLVLEGTLAASRINSDGGEYLLYYITPGELCSMSLNCCMSLQKSKIRIIAETDAEVCLVPVELLDSWMMKYRSWKEYMMYSYRKSFGEMVGLLDSLAFSSMEERLARFFVYRYNSTGMTIFNGKHLDIANHLNTSREVVSRILKMFEKDKLVSLSRNRIDYGVLVHKGSK